MSMNTKAFISGTGSRIKKLRKQLKCSRLEMARRLGIARITYDKNETGSTFPNMKTLKRLADDYNISMDWFIFGRGPMFFNEKDKVNELETVLAKVKQELEAEQNKTAAMEQELAQARELETFLEKVQKELETEQNKTAALEQELEQAEEQAKVLGEKTAGKGIAGKPEVRELLESMEQVPLLYHEVLAYFHRFKKENKEFAETSSDPGAAQPPG